MPRFDLTRQAARDLRDIHSRSLAAWGKVRADRYLDEIYAMLRRIAVNPASGQLRAHRSAPFLMVAAGRHFVVYDRVGERVVVLTVLHQVRDIERVIADMGPEFLAEIEALRDSGAGA
jgi:toxin ParE1/3/4